MSRKSFVSSKDVSTESSVGQMDNSTNGRFARKETSDEKKSSRVARDETSRKVEMSFDHLSTIAEESAVSECGTSSDAKLEGDNRVLSPHSNL